MSAISSNLKKACTAILLLSLLEDNDSYGYQMTQEIKKRTSGAITLQEGSMYTILYRLIDDGDIESYQVQSGPRMVRVYYKITPKGIDHLHDMKQEFMEQFEAFNLICHFKGGMN